MAGCSALARTYNTDRHNQVAFIIHRDGCCQFGFQWRADGNGIILIYRFVEMDDITMMWDTAIATAKMIGVDRPDICFRNKKTNTCLLIDISCTAFGNIAKKQAEKLAKYSDLWVEVSHMWQCRVGHWLFQWCWERWAQCTQVYCRVAGTLSQAKSSNLQHLQKTVLPNLLESSRILRKVMSSV